MVSKKSGSEANHCLGLENYVQPEKQPDQSKRRIITWEQFDYGCREIAEWARDRNYDDIYGIPRGGLVVAVRLSHLLGIPYTEVAHSKTLIVDDIADTGKTLRAYYGRCDIATLVYRRGSEVMPNKWVFEKRTRWVVFPWEVL